jgi:pyridoxal phosphate enzyme (YggS family)
MNNIAEQLGAAYQNIADNCQQQGRDLTSISLIAVSKTKPLAAIEAAYHAGQRQFGENYPQELVSKATELASLVELDWHFIGPLQSNKTKLVAEHANWVHSIDRLKIAERLASQRPAQLAPLNILLQVNISDETSKAGINPTQMLQLADAVSALPQLRLKGLMAIPAQGDNAHAFAAMQQLSKDLQQHYPAATELSMGMSDDWPLALKYGATMLRLGTAIFGARTYERNE